ncbi:tudor domain-containing 6 isoform X1 [Cyprinodon tularosa]|uniref:tudor domain-containing 6 isoform X1 n=1 Tax=Cyprinodon tularosa TaxID=77115 RepID=UPI0018E288AF|nr:tudor domain-containing 6 isoform X1 [Cyprinodon tularosa]
MSEIPELPTRGSDVNVVVTRVHLHPLCALVEFWGKFSQQRAIDYEILAEEIQSHGAPFKDLEGNPGDQCLVQVDTTWYRARIVSRDGSKYSVFLIDRGMTYTATTSKLAWGKKEHFLLHPEVELCILANVLPRSSENRWSPVALEFLKSFTGKLVDAHVQDVLVPDRMFLLDIPCISKQMCEMGFAKKLAPVTFKDFLLMSLKSVSGAEVLAEVQQQFVGSGERLLKQELFMYPELLQGTVETVIVTEVTNPQQIFCMLKVFSHEIKKLTEQITQDLEEKVSSCIICPDMVGYPCAAKGRDGRWYRSVIQQVFPANKVVEVLNVDYGAKQFVQMENVRPLAPEFLRMPVITYICSLHGILDKEMGWTIGEIDYLNSLLLYKTMIAKFERQSISDKVYHVTLFDDNNININGLFGSKENVLLKCGKACGYYSLPSVALSPRPLAQPERRMSPLEQSVEQKKITLLDKLPFEDLALNSSHLALVQHVSSPSEFWIQTENYRTELEELLDSLYQLYQDSANTHIVKNPAPGLYCVAQAHDGEYYRATVTEVGETQIKVFFVDYGNTEVVEKSKIKILSPEFKRMPQLGLKCTLAGVRPQGRKWSQSALDYFVRAVTDKTLEVHVVGKSSDGYVVTLRDPNTQGEQDVGAQLSCNGLAERTDARRKPIVEVGVRPLDISTAQLTGSGVPVQKEGEKSVKPTFDLHNNKRRVDTFKEQIFPIGSVLDVNVSFIDSPNDFWCQLVQSSGPLRLLMHNMQAYYAHSEFEPGVDITCVARHPEDGMWYRALIIYKHQTPQVDVMFVDYGQTATVSLFDLRTINSDFLALPGQAFRCSLYNPVSPASAINEWNCKAKERFQSFAQGAASDFIILKCTIYAFMYTEQRVLHNIVDLETPFESISTSLANLATGIPPNKATGTSFRLDTYYYSTHNIKTGTDEEVTVMFSNSISEFYCHLDKNADVMKNLTMRVNSLCHQLVKAKVPAIFGTLCFARYTDGQWYRAQIKGTTPKPLVHFVDYGDTLEVEKSDLLPVPKEANDIMSVPVQAVLCALSDLPADVPREVNEWFDKNATEQQFRALIVAREADGKLLVELYHGNTQINAKIKKTFQIEMQEEQIVYRSRKLYETAAMRAPKMERTFSNQEVDNGEFDQTLKKTNTSTPKPSSQNKMAGRKHSSANRGLYTPPHQRKHNSVTLNGSGDCNARMKPRKEILLPETEQLVSESDTKSQEENAAEKIPKLSDLPPKSIASGTAVDVYVSHCNSPLSFFVQYINKEDELFSLVEKLNEPESMSKANIIEDVHPGDLLKAEFVDDGSWYRAVVKETQENATALVEFIDFGNTAVIPFSKMEKLPKSHLLLPAYSTHCMLSDAAVLGQEKALDPNVMAAFKEDIGTCGEKVFKCLFIRQVRSVWEVRLEDSGMDIVCKLSTQDTETTKKKPVNEQETQLVDQSQEKNESETPALLPCTPGYPFHKEMLVGQQLEVYIMSVNEDSTFWCQSADSQELSKVTSDVSEVWDTADTYSTPNALSLGMSCLALFADDQLWYRAEVVDKNEDKVSVLFVDYGNTSQVSIKDIRAMPPALLEVPPQAFLCELEGFDSSIGSWSDGAANELFSITEDKLLRLTVTRVRRTKGKLKCVVELESEGQAINRAMQSCWKCFTPADVPDSGRSTVSIRPQQQLDSTNSVEDDLDVLVASNAACTEHSLEDVGAFPQGISVLELVSSPKCSRCSEDSNEEQDSSEGASILPAATMPPKDDLPSDSGIEEALQVSLELRDDQDVLGSMVTEQDAEEEDVSVFQAEKPDDESMQRAEAEEGPDDLETETGDEGTDFTSTCSLDMDPVNAVLTGEENAATLQADSMICASESNMDSQEDVLRKTGDPILESSKEAQPVPSSLTVAVQLHEQDIEAGDETLHEEQMCGSTDVKSDLTGEGAGSAQHLDKGPELLNQTAASISEEQTCTARSAERDEDPDYLACSLEETCPKGDSICDEKISEITDHLSHVMEQEITPVVSVSETDVCPLREDYVCDGREPAEESDEVQEESSGE